jgi:hypothetical protein
MKLFNLSYWKVIILAALLNPSISAQELELFEPIEATSRARGSEGSSARDSEGNIITSAEFTLIGTSRIGERYAAVIRVREDELISVGLEKGSRTPIPGYPAYQLVAVSSGSATISYPTDLPCVESREKGVVCVGNMANLSLTNAKPMEASIFVNGNGLGSEGIDQEVDGQNPINPFEALLERSINPEPGSGDEAQGFIPKRISSEDVPPGMRVVSTPFGDRLVEE